MKNSTIYEQMDILVMRTLIASFCICVSVAKLFAAPAAEEALLARIPEIFARSAAHYKALDAAATPSVDRDKNGGGRGSDPGEYVLVNMSLLHKVVYDTLGVI